MKVAEGAVSSTVEILKTLKEKAVNAANDSNTDSDRQTIQKELDQSIDQINDNANVTFNGKYLVDGSKNSKGNATYTVLTNQSLGTETTASTKLTDLTARSGDSLEIVDTDKVTVSYVQAGKTYSTTFDAKDAKLQDIFTKAEAIDDGSKIFADAMNNSVAASMGNNDKEAKAAIETADKAAYGDAVAGKILDGTYKADDLKAIFADGDLDGTAKAFNEKAVQAAVTAVNTYNAGAAADKKIDMSALKKYLNDTGDDFKDTSITTKMEFAKALKADKNYQANITDTKLANAKSMTDTYDAFKVSKDASDAAHTAVVSSSTVGIDAAGDKVDTASGDKGISITANKEGIGGQISGLNISITDSKGNVKKSANAALDAFSETVRAQNESQDNAISLQVGASANQSIKVGLTDMRAEALGLKGADGTTLNISTQGKANAAINVLDNAIQKALDQQTTIGSVESRLEYTSSNLTTASENVQASESTIRDADMAKEMTNYTKNNVLLQAAQSMLAQANQSSSNVLSLLQ